MTVVIENPIINSPFEEPKRHFLFNDEGITSQIVPGRRKSVYFVPIPKPKTKNKTLAFDLGVDSKAEENKLINDIRARVALWRAGGHKGVTQTTRRLLEHWYRPDRDRRLFFCQIEALETLIYLTEIAPTKDANHGTHLLGNLQAANVTATPSGRGVLNRQAAKMATGSGKTVVMAMLIAWQTLNKRANKQDKRFTDAFLVIAPGITIKDRLRTLLPSNPNNYYQALDLVPATASYRDDLGSVRIVITNYHGFMLREGGDAAGLTKKILTAHQKVSPFRETAGQMVQRVCGELGTKKQIIVLNDEAHHCYHLKPSETEEKLIGDDKREADKRNADARVWISGLEAIDQKIGIKTVYDLSATPFFLSGSGYTEGQLFPWVVSDFSLIDAIESGIVKVPRVPVDDNTDNQDAPLYRRLWQAIGKELPKGSRSKKKETQDPQLPKALQGALHHLYSDYAKAYALYEQQAAAGWDVMPPVFIVVCSNTQVSKLVFDWIAGYKKPLSNDQSVLVPGNLPIFSNVEGNGPDAIWSHRPSTLLIDSQQLESGEALSDDFKQAAAAEIDEFKAEIRERFPGRDVDKLSHEEILREVMNTVGKQGKLGEHIKCVVSVSMLTEGWDANTVTHILGVRAFGTQLLCEQVIGRGLRRMSYEVEPRTITLDDGEIVTFDAFPVEYAEVYGVPFEFLPTAGGQPDPKPPKDTVLVHSVSERAKARLTFPRLIGYRYEIGTEQIAAIFTPSSRLTLNTKSLPTIVENAPIVGESNIQHLDDLKAKRLNEVAFLLAKLVLETYFRHEPTEHAIGGPVQNDVKSWLFPQILDIARHWLHTCVECQDNTFPQLLLLTELAYMAAERVYQSIVSADSQTAAPTLKPILQPHNMLGDTDGVGYRTVKPTYRTSAKSPISHVVADSGWETIVAKALEQMDEVKAYVKNIARFDFMIPYTIAGREHLYMPDFIVRLDDGNGEDDLLNLLVEVSGQKLDDKDAKVATTQNLWVPAVNNDGRFGRWGFLEIKDPHTTIQSIRAMLQGSTDTPIVADFQLSAST